MASYDRNFTDELRTRLSIVDVVGRRVPLVRKGQNYWGCCPFHNEKTPSFSVNEEKGFYHCFGCGEHGDIISFTMKTNNMDFRAAITELAAQAGVKMPDYKPRGRTVSGKAVRAVGCRRPGICSPPRFYRRYDKKVSHRICAEKQFDCEHLCQYETGRFDWNRAVPSRRLRHV